MPRLLSVLVGPLVLLAAWTHAQAAEFTADLVRGEGLVLKKGKILVRGPKYRMELTEPDGPDLVVLVDPEANVSRVLVPRYELFMEVPCDDGLSRMNDPFQSAVFLEKHYDLKVLGTEEIAGVSCEKQVFEYGGQGVMHRWVSKKLGFPLRIEVLQQEGYFTALENVVEAPVPEAKLAVPDGYEKADFEAIRERIQADPEMEKKRKAFDEIRPRKREISPMLSPEDEIRVLLGKGVRARVEVKSGFEEPYAWFAIPHRGGKALAEKAKCTHEGNARAEFADEPLPDMIVAGVTKGKPSLKLRFVGRKPLLLAVLKRFAVAKGSAKSWSPLIRGAKITVTLTAEEDARGSFSASMGDFGKQETDKTDLTLSAGESKTFEFGEDEKLTSLDLSVMTGRVEVECVEDGRPPEERKPF